MEAKHLVGDEQQTLHSEMLRRSPNPTDKEIGWRGVVWVLT